MMATRRCRLLVLLTRLVWVFFVLPRVAFSSVVLPWVVAFSSPSSPERKTRILRAIRCKDDNRVFPSSFSAPTVAVVSASPTVLWQQQREQQQQQQQQEEKEEEKEEGTATATIAAALVELVQREFRDERDHRITTTNRAAEIEELVHALLVAGSASSSVSSSSSSSSAGGAVVFDPMTCINGKFFATVHTIQSGATTNSPLWETISSLNRRNIKGQKYTIGTNGDTATTIETATRKKNPAAAATTTNNNNNNNTVVNYSEILGRAIYLQAFGTFIDVATTTAAAAATATTTTDDGQPISNNNSNKKNLFVSIQQMLFGRGRRNNNNNSNNTAGRMTMTEDMEATSVVRNTCPYDYQVTVTGAALTILGRTITLPIQGTGTARVLYADPGLRILISPEDTKMTTTEAEGGGRRRPSLHQRDGDWESAGLMSIQIRMDLLDPNWDDTVL